MLNQSRVSLALDLKNAALEMNRAAVIEDFDNARYWAAYIAHQAASFGLVEVLACAQRVLLYLGPSKAEPTQGFGREMFDLAQLLIFLGNEFSTPAERSRVCSPR